LVAKSSGTICLIPLFSDFSGGQSMLDDRLGGLEDLIRLEEAQLDAIRQAREELLEQISQSRLTIERSQDLIKRVDALLGKSGGLRAAGGAPNAW
jgi:hypothetical protein